MDQPEIAEQHHVAKADLIWIGFVALAALAVWLRVWEPFQKISIIGIVPTATGGRSIWKEAFENLREMRMTMERTMAFALGWFYL